MNDEQRHGRRQRRATIVGAGVAGVLSVQSGAAPAAARPASPRISQADGPSGKALSPAEPIATRGARRAVDCTNPPDARDIYRYDIVRIGDALDVGDIYLKYSPTCRKVQAVAVINEDITACQPDGSYLRASVFHGTEETAHKVADIGLRKAATRWVGDANIKQYAVGVIVGPDFSARGDTPAF